MKILREGADAVAAEADSLSLRRTCGEDGAVSGGAREGGKAAGSGRRRQDRARTACAPELDVLRKRTVCASTVESVDRKMAADAAAAAPMPITN